MGPLRLFFTTLAIGVVATGQVSAEIILQRAPAGPNSEVEIEVGISSRKTDTKLGLSLDGPYSFVIEPPTTIRAGATEYVWITRALGAAPNAAGHLIGPGFNLSLGALAVTPRSPTEPAAIRRAPDQIAAAGVNRRVDAIPGVARPSSLASPQGAAAVSVSPWYSVITLARGQPHGSAQFSVTGLAGVSVTMLQPTADMPDFQFSTDCTSKPVIRDACSVMVGATLTHGNAFESEGVTLQSADTVIPQFDVAVRAGFSIISAAPIALQFGDLSIGDTATQTFTVQNSGFGMASLTTSIAGSSNFSATGCAQIGALSTCTVSVVYSPTALTADLATLNIQAADGGNPTNVQLQGNGAPSTLSVSPASLAFSGQLGTTQIITISNPASHAIIPSAISTRGPFAVEGQCGAIQPGASCQLTVAYAPDPDAVGQAASGTLLVSAQPPVSYLTVPLSTTANLPVISPAESSLDFGAQDIGKTSGPKMLTITNSGSQAAGIGVAASGDFTVGDVGCEQVAPGASCDVAFTFTPSAPGPRSGVALLTGVGTPVVVSLNGTGATPPAQGQTPKSTGPSVGLALGVAVAGAIPLINSHRDKAATTQAVLVAPDNLRFSCVRAGNPISVPIKITNTTKSRLSLSYLIAGPFEVSGCGEIDGGATCIAGANILDESQSSNGLLILREASGGPPLAEVQIRSSVATSRPRPTPEER